MGVVQDEGNVATTKPHGRSGRLILRLAGVFLLFAAVGVALNCALGYMNTRQTYFNAQADRLH